MKGGEGENICAWDLRGGHARVMYELSTGNSLVMSLAWHESSSSLLASCGSPWEDDRGLHKEGDWKRLPRVPHVPGGGYGNCSADAGCNSRVGLATNDGVPYSRYGSSSACSSMTGANASNGGNVGNGDQEISWWPQKARHQPSDFTTYFNVAHSCVLRYRFGPDSSRRVPRGSQPQYVAR